MSRAGESRRRNVPVSHGADKDANRMRVGDSREVISQPDGFGIERESWAGKGQKRVSNKPPAAGMKLDHSLIL